MLRRKRQLQRMKKSILLAYRFPIPNPVGIFNDDDALDDEVEKPACQSSQARRATTFRLRSVRPRTVTGKFKNEGSGQIRTRQFSPEKLRAPPFWKELCSRTNGRKPSSQQGEPRTHQSQPSAWPDPRDSLDDLPANLRRHFERIICGKKITLPSWKNN